MSGYPAQWESDVVLSDGRTVHVRPIRPDDAGGLYDLWSRLSEESIYLRFFSPMPRPSERQLEVLATVDYVDRMALVAELGDQLLGVARYDRRVNIVDAEVAFVVADEHQGRGIGTALLEHLAAAGRSAGVHRFVAETLPENRRMLGVFHDAGWKVESKFGDGVIAVSFPIEPTEGSRALVEAREQVAEVESVRRLLRPRSVAVVTSGEAGASGRQILRSLLATGFRGPVYPVASKPAPGDQRPYPSILHVPERVDLAVVAVDPSSVNAAVEDCARMGVAALMLVTESLPVDGIPGGSPAGHTAQPGTVRDLVGFVRRHGMRFIGPGAQGLLNTDPDVRLNATLYPCLSDAGAVSLATQRGGVATSELRGDGGEGGCSGHRFHELGIRHWVALGSKADVSGNDLLSYWESDNDTAAIALSLASFGNPRHFVRNVRRVAHSKPVVAAYPVQGPDDDTLLAQLGVIRVDTCDELIEAAVRVQNTSEPESERTDTASALDDPVTARIRAYLSWCTRAVGDIPPFDDIDLSVVEDLATSFLDRNDEGGPLSPEQAMQVCRAIGITTMKTRRVVTADEAVDVAADVGYPVAMKAASESLDYRDRTAWLHLDLRDATAVRTAFDALDLSLGEDMGGALLQPMAASGVPTAVVARRDERFDAVLTLHGGPGGRHGTGPRVVHVLPLADREASRLVETAAAAIFGADATPPGAEEALADALLRVGNVTAELPDVVELALDPLVLTPDGAQALDAYVRVASARVGPPQDVRHLA